MQQQQQQQQQYQEVDNGDSDSDRYAMLKSKRDHLIVRVYEAKLEIASLQAQMEALNM